MISVIGQLISGSVGMIDVLLYVGALCFVVFCATPLHEYAHALIAVKLGDDTPRLRGRLTINPMAHISAVGAIMIFLFGFGYAKPVEVRMRNFKKPKRDMALVALAGPVCNLLQALVYFFVCAAIAAASRGKELALVVSIIYTFFLFAAEINVNLAVFNLIPIPPLDGSRLATALLPSKYYYKIMQYERYIMIGLFVLLFTRVLTVPLTFLSNAVSAGLRFIAQLPFSLIG